MMNKSELNDAFNGAVNEMRENPESFVISFVAAMSSMIYMRASLMAIIDNPESAAHVAEYALEHVEEFSPTEIAKSLGMAAEGALN
jgi:hypothetical protein